MLNDKFILYSIGDGMRDIYTYLEPDPNKENRYTIIKEIHQDGGWDNVLNNLEQLIYESASDHKIFLNYITQYPIANIQRIFISNKFNFEIKKIQSLNTYKDEISTYKNYAKIALILSDYNLGTLSRLPETYPNSSYKDLSNLAFILVDSRYGTIHPYWLESDHLKILHVTGSEIYRHDLNKYRYVLHTDGNSPVKVYKDKKLIATLDVPDTKVIDTTGAGDTFTASVGFYLANAWTKKNDTNAEVVTDKLIIEACKFAIKKCQIVIQKFGAATP